MNHPLSEMMSNSMSKIKDMIDVNTVIGSPITTPDGVTLIPITKVSVGYGGGGSDFATKNYPANRDNADGIRGHSRRIRADASGLGACVHVGRSDRGAGAGYPRPHRGHCAAVQGPQDGGLTHDFIPCGQANRG